MCYVLRPVTIPTDNEEVLLSGCNKIETSNNYQKTFASIDSYDNFPISVKKMEEYYGCNNDEGQIYTKLADLCEEVFEDKVNYCFDYSSGISLKSIIKFLLFNLLSSISSIVPINRLCPKKYHVFLTKMYINKRIKRKLERTYCKLYNKYITR